MTANKFKYYFRVFRDLRRLMHSQARLEEVLDLVVRKTPAAIGAKGALLRLLNEETDLLEVRASWGMDERYLPQEPIPVKRPSSGTTSEQIYVIRDILNDPPVVYPLVYPRQAWNAGIRLILDVPLCITDKTVGLIRIYLEEERSFSEDEFDFIITITEQCACVIERVKLMQNQKARYDQLALHMEKLSSLGRMAAGIAHEINNPLAGILLYSSSLVKKVPAEGPLAEGLGIIISETQRCKTIIQGLLEFARDKEPTWRAADLNAALEKALAIVANEFYIRHIHIDKDLAPDLPPVLLDANQIEQVFINVLLNAAHAIDTNGRVSLRTRLESHRQRLCVRIGDTGCGIPRDKIDKIFDPFYSTKASGTGLGLAVSYGIIRNHRGDIRVASTVGRGTRVTILLPVLPVGCQPDP